LVWDWYPIGKGLELIWTRSFASMFVYNDVNYLLKPKNIDMRISFMTKLIRGAIMKIIDLSKEYEQDYLICLEEWAESSELKVKN